MKIDTVLLNMDEDDIAEYFLSKEALEVFRYIDKDLLVPARLRELVSKQIPHEEILQKKNMRHGLIDKLRPNQAKDLAKSLGIKINGNTYDALRKTRFPKNSSNEQKLFEFFEEELPKVDYQPKPDQEEVEPERGLFEHQRKAIEDIERLLNGDGHRCLLHMPTGSGKTRTAMRVITSLFEKGENVIIWLAYSEELCEQAIDEFKKTWSIVGNRPIRVSRFFGNHSNDILNDTRDSNGDFIVAGLDKIYSEATRKSILLTTLADRVSLVVMDEAHQAVAPTYKFVLKQLVEKHRDKTKLLGLSATPGRTWNEPDKDQKLADFFKRKRVVLDVEGGPLKFLTSAGYIAKQKIQSIEYQGKLTEAEIKQFINDLDISQSTLDKLAKDVERNIKINLELEKLVSVGHKRIIVFAASVDHAKTLSVILARKYRSFFIYSGTAQSTRDKIIEEYKSNEKETKILCNFGVLTTGFDAPKTSAVVIARPTKSLVLYSQMIGRGIRGPKVGGNKECTILTITDINLPGFRNMVDAFNNWDDVWD